MSTLKVNGLTYRTVERDVERLFDKYGKINEVFIPKDRFSRKSRGFAFVRFVHKDDARNAYDDLDRRQFDGRELRIEWSRKDGGNERRAAARDRDESPSPRRRSRSRDRRRKRSQSRSPLARRSGSRSEDRGGGSYVEKDRRGRTSDRSDSRGGFKDGRESRGAREDKSQKYDQRDDRSDRRNKSYSRERSPRRY
eukprot:GFUD01041601.1.p1 GENE.GFUD01041601.1~~GFUD01041601.1.p1  ORF type:complete len:195 (-),score=45.40 GFUD01041601.1:247-831(-)